MPESVCLPVRVACDWHDDSGNWFRSFGHERGSFDERALIPPQIASVTDTPVHETDRSYDWSPGRRPDDHTTLSDLGS
ncbi:MAG: DUF1348 family protein [Acetobacteraceae bacterium]